MTPMSYCSPETREAIVVPALSLAAVTAGILLVSEQVIHLGVQLAFRLCGI